MKKNEWNKQYYVEVEDITSNSEITAQDLQYELKEDYARAIRYDISQRIYQFLFDAYKGGQSKHHHEAIKYMIDQSETLQRYFLEAVIEYVRSIITIGSDARDYDPDGKPTVPRRCETILREAGLYITGDSSIPQHTLDEWNA